MTMACTRHQQNDSEYTEDNKDKYAATNNNDKDYAEEGSLTKGAEDGDSAGADAAGCFCHWLVIIVYNKGLVVVVLALCILVVIAGSGGCVLVVTVLGEGLVVVTFIELALLGLLFIVSIGTVYLSLSSLFCWRRCAAHWLMDNVAQFSAFLHMCA